MEVTALGFGTAALGNLFTAVSDEDARATVDAAWDAGLRYFDTAPHYGLGLSERRLGAALTGRPRDEFVVSTKVGRLLVPNAHPSGSDAAHQFEVPDTLTRVRDYSADGVRRSLEESLGRLGLDRVDVVLVHDPDDAVDQALAEAVPALVALREQGLIGAVGVGMNQWQALRRFVVQSDVDVVMVAGRWTLVDRSAEPLMAAAAERGVSVLAAAAYNSGLLASPWPADDVLFDYAPAPADVLAGARRWAARAEQHGVTLPDLALQFPLRHPATAAVVAGLRSPAEVDAAVGRMSRPVPEAVWADPAPSVP
ncbi:aldo/keto reductase [Microlunatus lacustris]